MSEGIKVPTTSYYIAGLLFYSGYRCVACDITTRPATFTFQMPHQASYDELADAWNSEDGQPLSSGRHYCNALKELDRIQRLARDNASGIWDDSQHGEEWWAKSREQIEARRRERQERERENHGRRK